MESGQRSGERAQGSSERHGYLFQRDETLLLRGLSGRQTSARGVCIVAGFFCGSLVLASLALPHFYDLLLSLRDWPGLSRHRILPGLAGWVLGESIYRVFTYLRLLFVLVCARAFIAELRVAAPGMRLAGLGSSGTQTLLRWLLSGIALLTAVAAMQWLAGAVHMRADASIADMLEALPRTIPLSIAKGIGIEVIFRGFVLSAFYAATRRPWLALVLSSLFFAYAYSKGPVEGIAEVGLATGWQISYAVLTGALLDLDPPAFAGLFLLGIVLGLLTLQTRSLWPAIGLQTALALVRLIYQDAFGLGRQGASPLWGGPQLTDGWLAVAVLGLLAIWIVRRPSAARP